MSSGTNKYVSHKPIASGTRKSSYSPLFKWAIKKQKESQLLHRANTLFPDYESIDRFNRLYKKTSASLNQPMQNINPQPNPVIKNIDIILKAYQNEV